MPIEEGDQFRLGKITFKNNKAITNTAALRSMFPLKDGDVFSRDKIAKGLENLRKAYGQRPSRKTRELHLNIYVTISLSTISFQTIRSIPSRRLKTACYG